MRVGSDESYVLCKEAEWIYQLIYILLASPAAKIIKS